MGKLSPVLLVILGLGLGFVLFKGVFGQTGAILPGTIGGSSGSGFTYQGRLEMEGVPVEGSYDFQFKLYGSASGNDQIGDTLIREDEAVAGGLFTVLLDFGAAAFDGSPRYLEIGVREGGSNGAYSVLLPRQPLTATPYALYATAAGSVPWSGLSGVPAGLDDGDDVGLTSVTWTQVGNRPAGLDDGDDVGLTSVSWGDVQGVPAGFADGVDDVGVTDVAWTDVQNRPPGLDDGDDVGLTSVDWTIVENRPAGLDDGDDDTTYSAGAGLALAGTEFGVISSTVQMRVADGCAPGSTIQAIGVDGSVVCASGDPLRRSAPPATHGITTVDSAGDVGEESSVTIGSDGLPIISYLDAGNDDLVVAHCDDVACSSASRTTVDGAGSEIAVDISLIIGSDGLPLLSYYDATSSSLKVAHCHDLACSSASSNTVTGVVSGTRSIDIMIGSDGLPFISYLNASELIAIHCQDIACTNNTATSLVSLSTTGEEASLAIGSDGLPVISYLDGANMDLKVARCQVISCTSAIHNLVDGSNATDYNAIAIGSDGLPIIAYDGGGLKVVHCNDLTCTTSTRFVVDSAPGLVLYPSITIGSDGLAIISYYDATNLDLKVAHCNDLACTSASATTVDSAGDVGLYTAITIGVDGLPLVSYKDGTNGDLKVAQCGNTLCVPYFRRR